MEQYIPKSALVAKIESLRCTCFTNFDEGVNATVQTLLETLDTLEAKEVDLEKEIDKFYGMYRKNGKTYSTEDNEECLDWKVDCNPNFEKAFAKHFFELGLKAQKGKEL